MFLPGLWPAYYKKAEGCKVWDLNNKMYYDFAGMGVTSCVLGYSNSNLNKSLTKGLKSGSMCTLNAPEEVDLAKKLLKIHKWSEKWLDFVNQEVKHVWLQLELRVLLQIKITLPFVVIMDGMIGI